LKNEAETQRDLEKRSGSRCARDRHALLSYAKATTIGATLKKFLLERGDILR